MENSTQICKHKDVNIRINVSSKSKIDWLKSKYNFASFNECFNELYYFFKNTNLSPREQSINKFECKFKELKTELIPLRNKIKSENKSIDKDVLTSISRQVNYLFENKKSKEIELRNNLLLKKEAENVKIIELNKVIEQLKKEVSNKEERIKSTEKNIGKMQADLNFYRPLHKFLKEYTKVEKQLLSSDKIVTEWNENAWKQVYSYKQNSFT